LQFPEIPVRSEDSILKSFCELFLSSIAKSILEIVQTDW
jgi:hypothetical protein